MVRALLGMSETPEPADAADALAVALCHVQSEQFRARLRVPAVKRVLAAESGRSTASQGSRSRTTTSRIS